MTVEKLINDSVEDVKEVFDKLDIKNQVDVFGNHEAMFNATFIKSFLQRLNVGDYEHFCELRNDVLTPEFDLSFNTPLVQRNKND